MDDDNDVLGAFRRLLPHQRKHVLALLPAELTPYEWRALHAITSRRSFHADIVGRLPLELVATIFTYLDPAAPYRLQAVSRPWSHRLRSPHVTKASLHAWYQGTLSLHHAHDAFCEKTARRIHAFRTGQPEAVCEILLDKPCRKPTLAGHHFIWTQNSATGSCAHILDLHAWKLRSIAGDAREQFCDVFASDHIALLTTFALRAYVVDLRTTSKPKTFTVPSRTIMTDVVCRGRTVACVGSFPKHTTVFIWDFDTQRGRSFDIKHESDPLFHGYCPDRMRRMCPFVQPDSETVILMFVIDIPRDDMPQQSQLVVAKYTYQGERISIFRPSLPDIDQIPQWPSSRRFVPRDDLGSVFTTHVLMKRRGDHVLEAEYFLLQFDQKTLDLSVCELSKLRTRVPLDGLTDSTAWWKDTCYGFRSDTGDAKGDMIAYMGTRDAEAYVPYVCEPREIVFEKPPLHEPIQLNEHYVIRVAHYAVYLLTFQENRNRPRGGEFFGLGYLNNLALGELREKNCPTAK